MTNILMIGKHALAFANYQHSSNSLRNYYGYYFIAKATDCVLLPNEKRIFKIPRGKRGFMGQSNIWYADVKLPEVLNFLEKVDEYIGLE